MPGRARVDTHVLAVLSVVGALASECSAQFPVPRVVALTGRPLAEVAGSTITILGRPSVGSNGTIYFTAQYSHMGQFPSVLLYGPSRTGSALIFRRQDEPVPERGPNVVWGNTFALPVAQGIDVAFTAGYGGGGVNGTGLWQSTEMVLSQIASNEVGSIAPGTTSRFGQFFALAHAGMNNTAVLGVRASIAGPATADSGFWFKSWLFPVGGLGLFALEGAIPPGLPADVIYDDVSMLPLYDPAVSHFGVMAFLAPLRGNVTAANNRAIIAGDPVTKEVIARTGSPAPGMPAGAVYAALDRPWLHEDYVLFSGRVTGGGVTGNDDEGLWIRRWPFGTAELVVREGIVAPEIGGTILLHERTAGVPNFRNNILCNPNLIYFMSGLLGTGINNDNDNVVYRVKREMPGQPWTFTLVAREGTNAPGLTPGVDRYGPFGNVWANVRGELAFTSQVQGSSFWALYGGSPGFMKAIAVANRPINVGAPGPPDLRTISAFFSQFGTAISAGGGGGIGDGLPTCVSQAGTLVFRAEITGGAGIFEVLIRSADFNGSGDVTVQDIFEFLQAYFLASPDGDFNGSGDWSPQDIFDFIERYFSQAAPP